MKEFKMSDLTLGFMCHCGSPMIFTEEPHDYFGHIECPDCGNHITVHFGQSGERCKKCGYTLPLHHETCEDK